MDFITRNKTTLIGLIVLGGLVWAYFTYFSGSTSEPLTTQDANISGNLLITLGSLHTIRLDNSIFTDPVFLSLSDFGTTIPPQASGRGNPFAPLGSATPAQPPAGSPAH